METQINYERMWTHFLSHLKSVIEAPDAPEALRDQDPKIVIGFGYAVETIVTEMEKMQAYEEHLAKQSNNGEASCPSDSEQRPTE